MPYRRTISALFLAAAPVVITLASTALASVALAGCSGREPTGSGESAILVNPVGNEDEAILTISLPADACMPGIACAKVLGQIPQILFDGNNVAPGATGYIKTGAHTLSVNGLTVPLTATSGQQLTIVLPVVEVACVPAALPTAPLTNFGVTPAAPYNVSCPSFIQGAAADTTPLFPSTWEVFPPDTLTVNVNGSNQSITVASGDEPVFNVNLPVVGSWPATFGTTITFLSPRQNPDAYPTIISNGCGGSSWSLNLSPSPVAPAPIALSAFVDAPCTANNTLYTGLGQTLPLSESQPNAVTLNRVDVNDITLTRDDGTTYVVNGTWTLTFNGQTSAAYATGTGVDVLSGNTYVLTISYMNLNGPQTTTQTLTL